MPTQQDVENARNKVTTSATNASEWASGSYDVESVLKQKLDEAYNSNQDIVSRLDDATSNYLSAPSTAREKYQNIFNPFTREKLVSQYTNQEAVPMQSYANLYGSRVGSIADILKAGTGAYSAQASAAQNQATIDQQDYSNLWNEYNADREYQLKLQEANSKGSSGSTFEDLIKNLKNFEGLGPNSTQQTKGAQAESVIRSMDIIDKADDKTLKRATIIAQGKLGGNITKLFATPAELEVADALTTVRNTLRLEFTGAGFSPTEMATYTQLTADPVKAFNDPQSVKTGLVNLRPYFEKTKDLGQNQYQSNIDMLKEMINAEMGIQSAVREIRVRRKADGMTGMIPENEFDGSIYERI